MIATIILIGIGTPKLSPSINIVGVGIEAPNRVCGAIDVMYNVSFLARQFRERRIGSRRRDQLDRFRPEGGGFSRRAAIYEDS